MSVFYFSCELQIKGSSLVRELFIEGRRSRVFARSLYTLYTPQPFPAPTVRNIYPREKERETSYRPNILPAHCSVVVLEKKICFFLYEYMNLRIVGGSLKFR